MITMPRSGPAMYQGQRSSHILMLLRTILQATGRDRRREIEWCAPRAADLAAKLDTRRRRHDFMTHARGRPVNIPYTNEGIQNPVVTVTRAAPTSPQPRIRPTRIQPVANATAVPISIAVPIRHANRRGAA